MGGRVDEPGRVKAHNSAKKDAPKKKRPPPHEQKNSTQDGHGYPMPLAEPHMKLISAKVGDVWQEDRGVVMNALTCQDPAHMRP